MKRIFSILMCIIMLSACFIMPLSIHAEEEHEHPITNLTGTTWVLNEVVSPIDFSAVININFESNGNSYNTLNFVNWYDDFDDIRGENYIRYTLFTIEPLVEDYIDVFEGAVKSDLLYLQADYEYLTISISGGEDVQNETLISWLLENGEVDPSTICDGTGDHEILDSNEDGICENCGMAVYAVRSVSPPSNWPSTYPFIQTTNDANYYIFKVHSTGKTYLVEYSKDITPTFDSTTQNGLVSINDVYSIYTLDSSNNWEYYSDVSPYTVGGYNNGAFENIYSSVQIKDETGENFFPIPLHQEILGVTKGEIPQFSQTLGGNLMILTLCGVGCLTLLVALALLFKTLRTSLLR